MSQEGMPTVTVTSPRLTTRPLAQAPAYRPMRRSRRRRTAEPGLLGPDSRYSVLAQLHEANEELNKEKRVAVYAVMEEKREVELALEREKVEREEMEERLMRDIRRRRGLLEEMEDDLKRKEEELRVLRERVEKAEERARAAERELAFWRGGREGIAMRERSPFDERRERRRLDQRR